MKFGKKLIIAMAIISIVPSLIIAAVVNNQMQSSVRNLQMKSLESLANVVSAHIYDFCNGQEMDSRFLGQVTAYRECLMDYKKGGGSRTKYWRGEVQNLFDRTTTINDNIDGGALISADGTIILSYDKSEEGKSALNTEMYRSIMEGSELYRSTIVNKNGSRNINIVVPIKDDGGAIIGMLKRIINLSNINLYIDEVEIGNSGYVYVIDENATLIYHGSKEKMDLAVGEFQDREELDDLLKQVASHKLKNRIGIIQYDNRGVDTIAAYSQIEELDWVVLVAMDNGEIQAPVDRATQVICMASILVGLLAALSCYLIVQSMLFPFAQLRQRLRRIAEGNYTVRCEFTPDDELAQIMEGVNDMAVKLEHGEAELSRSKERDALTGIFNRTSVLRIINERLNVEERQAVLILDLDDFGVVNETMGQAVGDGVLVEIAAKISALSSYIYCVGRFSGDRFILLAESWQDENAPKKLAQRIRNEIEKIKFVVDRPVHVTGSIGIAYIDDGEADLNIYLKRAQVALHKAKNSGKNTEVVFSDEF